MSIVLRPTPTDATASAANGFAPFAGVPPVRRWPVSRVESGGTPYPLHRKGSEFNQVAPHTPERRSAPRSAMSRQYRRPRAPPVLDGMARHD